MESKRGRRRKTDNKTAGGTSAKQRKLQAASKKVAGDLLCLGEGSFGQIGLGENVLTRKKPALVNSIDEEVIKVACGGMHTACITTSNTIYTFGCNDEGPLGRETADDGSEFEPGIVGGLLEGEKVVDITAGDSHTAALTDKGEVFLWGCFRDSHGKLGLIEEFKQCNLPQKLNLPSTVKKISSGTDHLAILTTTRELFTIGCGEQGQLGRISRYFTDRGGRRKAKDENNNEPEKSSESEKQQNLCLILHPVRIPRRRGQPRNQIEDIYAGAYSTFVITSSGHMYTFGLNNFNQLGIPDEENKFMPTYSTLLSSRSWKQVCCGQHHTLLLENQTDHVYVVGRGEYGRLGLGKDVLLASKLMRVEGIEDVASIGTGSCVSFAITKNGEGYAWGMGTNLQLTTGEEDDEWTPVKISGKNLETRSIVQICGGGQHTAMIAANKS